jgi:hypothetical protein
VIYLQIRKLHSWNVCWLAWKVIIYLVQTLMKLVLSFQPLCMHKCHSTFEFFCVTAVVSGDVAVSLVATSK